MKKRISVEDAKRQVAVMLGKDVSVRINRGRNRIKYCRGTVSEMHNNVFVVSLVNEIVDRMSCSYVDIVCGEIKMKETPAPQA